MDKETILEQLQPAKTAPHFLEGNSTSHTWVFSALAELIDNAYDPDVSARRLYIDKEVINNEPCLTLTDNGCGLDSSKLHKMLSLGYSEKTPKNGHMPIGQYGNGFKSGSMRLGDDAVVFSKQRSSLCVGLLSRTFLKEIGAETVLVPILAFASDTYDVIQTKDSEASLNAFCKYSIFKSKEELLRQFHRGLADTFKGTRIVIYNLKRTKDGLLELDFDSDESDILNSERMAYASRDDRRNQEHIPLYYKSLKEYCSILYLKPRMTIELRGKKVPARLIEKSLDEKMIDRYAPRPNQFPFQIRPLKITYGMAAAGSDYGMMLYHKNRLIKAYEKVGCQKQLNDWGVGVVGIAEVNFLTPNHTKQDFVPSPEYNCCLNSLGDKLNDYWKERSHMEETMGPNRPTNNQNDNWAMCDKCNKWRRLPLSQPCPKKNDKWYCHYNLDRAYNRCDIGEELLEHDEEDVVNKKTYKHEEKKRKEMEKKQQEEVQRLAIMRQVKQEREKDLENIKKKEMELQKRQAILTELARQGFQQIRANRRVEAGVPAGEAVASTSAEPATDQAARTAQASERKRRAQSDHCEVVPKARCTPGQIENTTNDEEMPDAAQEVNEPSDEQNHPPNSNNDAGEEMQAATQNNGNKEHDELLKLKKALKKERKKNAELSEELNSLRNIVNNDDNGDGRYEEVRKLKKELEEEIKNRVELNEELDLLKHNVKRMFRCISLDIETAELNVNTLIDMLINELSDSSGKTKPNSPESVTAAPNAPKPGTSEINVKKEIKQEPERTKNQSSESDQKREEMCVKTVKQEEDMPNKSHPKVNEAKEIQEDCQRSDSAGMNEEIESSSAVNQEGSGPVEPGTSKRNIAQEQHNNAVAQRGMHKSSISTVEKVPQQNLTVAAENKCDSNAEKVLHSSAAQNQQVPLNKRNTHNMSSVLSNNPSVENRHMQSVSALNKQHQYQGEQAAAPVSSSTVEENLIGQEAPGRQDPPPAVHILVPIVIEPKDEDSQSQPEPAVEPDGTHIHRESPESPPEPVVGPDRAHLHLESPQSSDECLSDDDEVIIVGVSKLRPIVIDIKSENSSQEMIC